MKEIKCPVCEASSKIRYTYDREKCLEGYRHLYENVPEDLDIKDYQLYQCTKCQLVFADPMVGGSQSFYTWVTGHENYYPTKNNPRWEWTKIREYLWGSNKEMSVLEIGCGKGDFLEYVTENHPNIKGVGIDTTKTSYEVCRQKGLEVYNVLLEEYAKEHKEKFDLVVAFHCVEHVEYPLQFVKKMIECMKPEGKCIVSFPYSELRLENCFSSSNNFPPHHMTRWNIGACRMLAAKVGCDLEVVCPSTPKFAKELKDELKNIYYPLWTHKNISDIQLVCCCIRHFWKTIKVAWVKITRDKVAASYEIGQKSAVKRRMPWFVMLVLEKHEREKRYDT